MNEHEDWMTKLKLEPWPTQFDAAVVGFTSIGQTLYAITWRGTVYRSSNYGGTWQRRELTRVKRFAKTDEEVASWVDV